MRVLRSWLVGGPQLGLSRLAAGVVALLAAGTAGCEPGALSPGVEPPDDALFFPQGLLLDPRVSSEATAACVDTSECDAGQSCAEGVCRAPARWLLVANSNSDLTYNAGTMIPYDLQAFLSALADPAQVGDVGSSVSAERPCRRAELQPQLIECEESYFAAAQASIHFGAFAMQPTAWNCEVLESSPAPAPGEPRPQRRLRYCDPDEAMILTPINGDPSVTYAYLRGGLDGSDDIELECGQGPGSGESDDRRCSDDFRIRYFRNDASALPLPRELTTMRVANDAHTPWAYITHRARSAMSLLKLDGLQGGREEGDWRDPIGEIPAQAELQSERPKPAFVDFQSLFAGANGGGFGLAERPCDLADPPTETNNCTRPHMYAGYRQQAAMVRFSSAPLAVSSLAESRECLLEGAVPDAGEVDCDPKFLPFDLNVLTGGLQNNLGGALLYGDLEFTRDGEELFVVQSAPGALIRINTGLDALGRTIDEPNAFVELCDRPAALTIYDDGVGRYGLTTCYRSALVYVVDLDAMRVVAQVRAGTGPNRIISDLAREYVYVANTLDSTISVIDMSRDRATRFSQVARLGLQEPFDP